MPSLTPADDSRPPLSSGAPDRPDGQPPTCNTGVVNGNYGWDWTQTTHDARGSAATVKEVLGDVLAALGGTAHVPGKGLQGWAHSVEAFDSEGYKLGQVYYGGDRTDVHVKTTGGAADQARPKVSALHGAKTARVDTRVDTLVPYDELVALFRSAAGQKAQLSWWDGEKAGVPTGRTIYLGSPTSQVRLRAYEKHLESPGQYLEGTNRVEVQFRPPSRGKALVSTWSAAETFCASELSRRVAALLGSDVAHPETVQKQRPTPDLERTLQAMGHQYGPGVERWLNATGGDVGRVLDYLLPKGA